MLSKSRKTFFLLFTILFAISIILSSSVKPTKLADNSNDVLYEPHASYLPKYYKGLQPIGNVTITSIQDLQNGIIIVNDTDNEYGMEYPENIGFDYLTEFPSAFLGVQQIADSEVWDTSTLNGFITIRINETVKYDYYYNDSRTITHFKSALAETQDSQLHRITLNGTEIDLENETVFRIIDNAYVFNYSSFRPDVQYPNGSLIMGYEIDYDLPLRQWQLVQPGAYIDGVKPIYLNDNLTVFDAYFNYTFAPGGLEHDFNMSLTFLVNLPDVEYFSDFSMTTYTGNIILANTTPFTEYDSYSNKSISFSADLNTNSTTDTFSINSKTNYTIEFKNRYISYWSQDSLYSGRDIRRRVFEISCISGPPSIAVSHFSLNETTIPFNDKISISSSFIDQGAQSRIITSSNMSALNGIEGITVFSYEEDILGVYKLYPGETDVITISYSTPRSLDLTIMDQINTPIQGAEIRVFYSNKSYGTVMSAGTNYPISPKFSANNGQISIPDMPYGNFTIEVYFNGEYIGTFSAATTTTMNYIYTSIPHFPTTILVFLFSSLAFVAIGFFIYNKNQQ